MSKTAKSFRLSPQALETLAHLVELTGSNETAIVEISLAHFRKTFDHAPIEQPKPVPAPISEHEKFMPKSKEHQLQREERKAQQADPEPPPNFPEYVQPVDGKKKKRKRRH